VPLSDPISYPEVLVVCRSVARRDRFPFERPRRAQAPFASYQPVAVVAAIDDDRLKQAKVCQCG